MSVTLIPVCGCTERDHSAALTLSVDVAAALDAAGYVHLEVLPRSLYAGVWVTTTTDGLTREQSAALASDIAGTLNAAGFDARGEVLTARYRSNGGGETYSVHVTVSRRFGWTAAA